MELLSSSIMIWGAGAVLFFVLWVITALVLKRARIKLAEAQHVCISTQAHLDAAKDTIETLRSDQSRMTDQFRDMAARALQDNQNAFLDMAGATFDRSMQHLSASWEDREARVKDMLSPMQSALGAYQTEVREMEKNRENVFGRLAQQITSLSGAHQSLEKETTRLANALSQPQVRGRWGELTLRRVAELAGMVDRCDFDEQVSAATGTSSRIRPDMVVHLPGNRIVVVDAKVPLSAYLDAMGADTDAGRNTHLKKHARQVAAHAGQLSQKAYWQAFDNTPEFVVLFIPGEPFFGAALSHDPGLIDTAAAKNVILATPATLIALLKTVAHAWSEDSAAQNARDILNLGQTLCERIHVVADHMNRLGRDIEKTAASYNKALGSLDRRVMVTARQCRDMGVAGVRDMAVVAGADVDLKQVSLSPDNDDLTEGIAFDMETVDS